MLKYLLRINRDTLPHTPGKKGSSLKLSMSKILSFPLRKNISYCEEETVQSPFYVLTLEKLNLDLLSD